jgi:hypothetical protein
VNFDGGKEPVYISFNPCDINITKKLLEAEKNIIEKAKNTVDFDIDENGRPNSDEYIEAMNELNNFVYAQIDYAFGNEISREVFKHISPFTLVNGERLVSQFIYKIVAISEKIINEENKKAYEKMKKYLQKYAEKNNKQ